MSVHVLRFNINQARDTTVTANVYCTVVVESEWIALVRLTDQVRLLRCL
ncbi:unnamed protein product [Acanthoscelides obtectus]|uniref:Uncharacterized protein n=1 Tax=Acanthoscelides obtectus TaxID=200917 RepID=A0A9P0JMF7_ACAOB|nr:unnamed protein product [Acanthoscelides obtectus]CAK1665824.1 hypothetical protein AOBTE_LOCUS24983 [Acanthoscelides obtectus]